MCFKLPIAMVCVFALSGQTPPPNPTPDTKESESKPATVSGKTVSEAGQALKKAVLTLRWVGTAPAGQAIPSPYTASSDAEGNFVFEAVEPGSYMLSADKPGFQRQNYGSRHALNGGTVLTLKGGQVVTGANLTLSPQIVISGKVLDPDGDPVARTQVRVWRTYYFNGAKQMLGAGYANTDENGEYKVQSMGPGKYFVSAYPPRDQYFGQSSRSATPERAPGQPVKQEEAAMQTYYPGVTDAAAATAVELKSGHDRPGTDITLRKAPVFHVRGKVAGQVPADRSQLRVSILPRSAPYLDLSGNASSPIGKDGSFDLSPVPAGAFNIVLLNQAGNFKTLAVAPIEVADRNTDNVGLTVESPIDMTGQVTAEKPAGAADDPAKPKSAPLTARIGFQVLDQPSTNPPAALVGEDGSFNVTGLLPARYRVYVSSLPDTNYLKSIRYGDQDVLRNSLSLPPGGGAARLEVLLGANAAKLEGNVLDSEGKPAASATVTLVPDPLAPDRLDLYHQTNTDKDGHFTLKRIAPGTYRVYSWENLEMGSLYDPEFLKNYQTKGSKLDFSESAAPQITLNWIKQQ